jgi:hypothetical protein
MLGALVCGRVNDLGMPDRMLLPSNRGRLPAISLHDYELKNQSETTRLQAAPAKKGC